MTAKGRKRPENGKYLLIFSCVLVLDQLTKFLATQFIEPLGRVMILPFFSLYYTTNTGAGFSILTGNNIILSIISVIVVGALLYKFKNFKIKEKPYITMIIAGASGNLLDRLIHGFVIDYLSVGFWPVFNIADSAITIGIVGLVYYSIKN